MSIKTNKEYHKNGKLAYIETIKFLSTEEAKLHFLKPYHPKGNHYIRINKQAKYYDNGQLAWVLNYDEMGNVLKENNISYRKDGTIIVY